MATLTDILQEMADHLDGVIAISVAGADGLTIAEHNPEGRNMDAFSARFAAAMNVVEKSINNLAEWGDFKKNLILIQTSQAWILVHLLKNPYFLGIAMGRDGNLRDLRLMAKKYARQLREAL